jgi:hypothetical protein
MTFLSYDMAFFIISFFLFFLGLSIILLQYIPVSSWQLKGLSNTNINIQATNPQAVITGTSGNYISANMTDLTVRNAIVSADNGQGQGLIICSSLITVFGAIAIILMGFKINGESKIKTLQESTIYTSTTED